MSDFKNVKAGERVPFKSYAVADKNAKFQLWQGSRHAMGEHDIIIEIKYCGICHSDIHSAKSEWHEGIYPMVPGHEIAGQVVAVGSKVTKFKVGDFAGVGCMVNGKCGCPACSADMEQYCEEGKTVFTYDCADIYHGGEPTYGGYSDNIVVRDEFAVSVPSSADLARVAPLLCAGITTYSPLKRFGIRPGHKVAIAGFGGLGLMGAKYALAMGAEVSIFARNRKKEKIAKELGCKALYDSTDARAISERFDFILCTIPANYDLSAYVRLLKHGGEFCVVGLPPLGERPSMDVAELVFAGQKKLSGSCIGSMKETQEMLDFSLKAGILPEIQVVKANQIDWVYEQLLSGAGDFRYVIDMSTL